MNQQTEPDIAKDAVFKSSTEMLTGTPIVRGFNWDEGIDYDNILSSYINSGFQATNFGKAVSEIQKMVIS